MTGTRAIIVVGVWMILWFFCQPPAAVGQEDISIDAFLSEMQKTLARVQTVVEEDALPEIRTVLLRLNITLAVQVDGRVSYQVIPFGASVPGLSVQTLTLMVDVPEASSSLSGVASRDTMASALVEAIHVMARARRGNPPLDISRVTIKLGFVIKPSGSGVKFVLLPVTPEDIKGLNNSAVQTIIVECRS